MALLNQGSLDFILKAREKTNDIAELSSMFDNPNSFAISHELQIDTTTIAELSSVGELRETLNLSPEDTVNQELLSFFNNVVIDGRYILEWMTNPQDVADELNLTVSQAVFSRINTINFSQIIDSDCIPDNFIPVHIIVEIIFIVVSVINAPPAYLSYAIQPIIVDVNSRNKV